MQDEKYLELIVESIRELHREQKQTNNKLMEMMGELMVLDKSHAECREVTEISISRLWKFIFVILGGYATIAIGTISIIINKLF